MKVSVVEKWQGLGESRRGHAALDRYDCRGAAIYLRFLAVFFVVLLVVFLETFFAFMLTSFPR
jgi:hypothetical protein